jgi:hypothetical protein
MMEKGFELISDETIQSPLYQLDFRVLRPELSYNSPDEQYESKAAHFKECQGLGREGKMILLYK